MMTCSVTTGDITVKVNLVLKECTTTTTMVFKFEINRHGLKDNSYKNKYKDTSQLPLYSVLQMLIRPPDQFDLQDMKVWADGSTDERLSVS